MPPVRERGVSSDLRDQLQTTLGSGYTLERELGGGGMSRVFVVQEVSLGRTVVVKVLPPEMAASVSIGRFKREIALAARLQHPHIVPVLFAGETQGLPFYAMPFVKGESLRARLAREGELGVNETVRILRDIASALAHAHAEGVVHRDIKPENVILSGGVAVVTDFGVAKAVDLSASDGGSVRTAGSLTSLGVALGTPTYMAPEQASGDPHVDHRADLYAFGCVAYEMLAGTPPFAGRPAQQVLAAHVNEAPVPVTTRRPSVPPTLAALVMHCLAKRPSDRPASAEEILQALDAITTPSGGITPTTARLRALSRTRHVWPAVAVTALVAVAALTWAVLHRPSPAIVIGATQQITASPEPEVDASISPDGKLVAYASGPLDRMRLYVRQIAGGRAVPLAPDDSAVRQQRFPTWSPDGSQIVYTTDQGVMLVPALGGTPRKLFTPDSANAMFTPAWSPDGKTLAYAQNDGIWTRAIDGGPPRRIVTRDGVFSPSWSPDGRWLAYASDNPFYLGLSLQILNRSPSTIWVVPVRGGAPVRVTDGAHMNVSPVWMRKGFGLLYISDAGGARDVYEQRLQSDGAPDGPALRLTTGLNPYAISLSSDGSRLAYSTFVLGTDIRVAPIAANGTVSVAASRSWLRENVSIELFDVSADGKWMAYDATRQGNSDIWKQAVAGGDPIQLTNDPADDFSPAWSPDGRQIFFHSWRTGNRDLFVMDADGRNVQRILDWPSHEFAACWAPDGRGVMFISDSGGHYGVYRLDRGPDARWGSPRRLALSGPIPSGRWSGDGQWLGFPTQAGDFAVVSSNGGPTRILARHETIGGIASFITHGAQPSTFYFGSSLADGSFTLWSVDGHGSTPKAVLRLEADQRPRRPQFTTDGKLLYFAVAADQADVWVMDLGH